MPASENCSSRSFGTGWVKVRLNCISAGQSIFTPSATPLPASWRLRSITSVTSTNTFFGSQPRSAHVPPNGRESTMVTFQPAERHSFAAVAPAAPVPMTMRSKFFVMRRSLFLRSIRNRYLTLVCFSQNRAMSGPLAHIITHDDAHFHHACDGGHRRRKRRLRAGRGPAPLQEPLRSHGAYPRSRGRAEYEEPGFEFR